jgi:hypothetical protein
MVSNHKFTTKIKWVLKIEFYCQRPDYPASKNLQVCNPDCPAGKILQLLARAAFSGRQPFERQRSGKKNYKRNYD